MDLLKRMLRNRAGLTTAAIGISVLSIIVSLWWNLQLSNIINTINGNIRIPARMITVTSVSILANAGVAYALGILSGWFCETLAHDLRMGYARHFATLPIIEIEDLGAGEQISRLQNEITDVSGFLRDNVFDIAYDSIRFIGTFTWLLWLNPMLTVFTNLPVILIMLYTVYSSKVIEGLVQKSQQANGKMGAFTDTMVTLFPILRIFNASALLSEKYDRILKQWEAYNIREERTRAKLMSLSALLSSLPLLFLLVIGGYQVINGIATIGTLYIFLNLSGNVSGVMMNMPERIAAFRRFSANTYRLLPLVLLEDGGRPYGHKG